MRARFLATLHPDGRISLEIASPDDLTQDRAGVIITDASEGAEPEAITPLVLDMLARAYEAGYWHGMAAAKRAMMASVPTLHTPFAKPPQPKYPNPRAVECLDASTGARTTLAKALAKTREAAK
jgi:hypothetical protein